MKNIQSSFPRLLPGLLCCFLADCNAASSDDNLPVVPIIDLAPWTTPKNSTNDSKMEVVRQIHEACQSVGFFLVTNHGLESQVSQGGWKVTQDFFNLPGEQKIKHKTANQAEYPYGFEQSEKLVKGKQLDGANKNLDEDSEAATDLKETFGLGPENEDSGMPQRRWIPTSVSTFQQALEDYYAQMEELALNLLRIMALALEQPESFFADKMGHHLSALRLVNYYSIDPPLHQEQVMRAGAHTDYGALTILNAQDAGLQIFLYNDDDKTTGRWYPVPLVPGALIINLGDLMQRWTNGTNKQQLSEEATVSFYIFYSHGYFALLQTNGSRPCTE
jgi:isopenicillin N synthase-like dioxygenase